MTNIKIVVAYDGTDFCGWQRQPEGRTVQGEIEAALARIAGKRVAVTGAGRTDAGVHARGQVANFRADFRLAKRELERALNAILPDEIRILSAQPRPGRIQRPEIGQVEDLPVPHLQCPCRQPVRFPVRPPLVGPPRCGGMAEAARLFVRKADFSAFSSNRLLHPVRRVVRSEIRRRGREIVYTVEANGFLRYMVRTIVGTLLEVGRGRMEPLRSRTIFRLKSAGWPVPTAPAKGLCLLKGNLLTRGAAPGYR